MKRLILACGIMAICSAVVYADDPLSSSIQIGGSWVTGNSESTDITASYTRDYEQSFPDHPWGYNFSISGETGTSQGVQSARNVSTTLEGRYQFSLKTYTFLKGSYIYDEFATYDIVNKGAVGLGRILYKTDKQKLTLEVGPGVVRERVAGLSDYNVEITGNIDARYSLKLNDNVSFKQTAEYDIGSFNDHIKTVTSIQTKLIKNLALNFSFQLDYDSKIPAGSSNTFKTDTSTNLTVMYTF